MSTPKHTPGPWSMARSTSGMTIRDADVIEVVTVPGYTTLSRERAARIVRAVNNHDALVAALRDLLEQLDGIGIPDWHGAEGLDLEPARAALRAAEGE